MFGAKTLYSCVSRWQNQELGKGKRIHVISTLLSFHDSRDLPPPWAWFRFKQKTLSMQGHLLEEKAYWLPGPILPLPPLYVVGSRHVSIHNSVFPRKPNSQANLSDQTPQLYTTLSSSTRIKPPERSWTKSPLVDFQPDFSMWST